MSRRSRLVGRPMVWLCAGSGARRRISAFAARCASEAGVSSKSSAATGAEERTPLRPRTTTVRTSWPMR
eukprot:gene18822-37903_t